MCETAKPDRMTPENATPKATTARRSHRPPLPGVKPARVRRPVREALIAMVERGESIAQAALGAGLKEHNLRTSLLRHNTRELYQQLKAEFVERMTNGREMIAAQAVAQIIHMSEKAQSETTRLKCLVFLASMGKAAAASKAPPAPAEAIGYAYQRPVTDSLSGGAPSQPIAIEGKAASVGAQGPANLSE